MADPLVPFLWGFLKPGAVRPNQDNGDCVDLIIGGQSVCLSKNDPGVRHLSLYRQDQFRQPKKALVMMLRLAGDRHHVYAVFFTNDKRLVSRLKRIMADNEPEVAKRLIEASHPTYLL